MPKGYIVARVSVSDSEAYAAYAKASVEALAAHGGRALVRAGRFEVLEGASRPRNVILEFESFDKARAYYHSAEYQAARLKREGAATADIVVIEGADQLVDASRRI